MARSGRRPRRSRRLAATDLVQVGNQFFLRDGGGVGPSLKARGGRRIFPMASSGAWTPGSGRSRRRGAIRWPGSSGADDQYIVWNTDGSGNWTSYATGVVSGSNAALQLLETAFQQDLNGSGQIGPDDHDARDVWPRRTWSQVGNQFFLRDGGGVGPVAEGRGGGRIPRWPVRGHGRRSGAEQTAGGYQVAWKLGADDQYIVWNTDGSGNWTSYATGVVSGSNVALFQLLETAFQQDLNGSGQIGPTTTTLETFGRDGPGTGR